ncbi:hypothetical protein C0Q70_21142 [Pomacea canaliculata]|uniref:Uncharacterized protein n=1 Tax=Pomacea canaliculata TaxID=400727 RepID=A0A2T7NBS3_POMCA|nr:hypothetical protein C0Q70_21142 [Pomacea canaliculata]
MANGRGDHSKLPLVLSLFHPPNTQFFCETSSRATARVCKHGRHGLLHEAELANRFQSLPMTSQHTANIQRCKSFADRISRQQTSGDDSSCLGAVRFDLVTPPCDRRPLASGMKDPNQGS